MSFTDQVMSGGKSLGQVILIYFASKALLFLLVQEILCSVMKYWEKRSVARSKLNFCFILLTHEGSHREVNR